MGNNFLSEAHLIHFCSSHVFMNGIQIVHFIYVFRLLTHTVHVHLWQINSHEYVESSGESFCIKGVILVHKYPTE